MQEETTRLARYYQLIVGNGIIFDVCIYIYIKNYPSYIYAIGA